MRCFLSLRWQVYGLVLTLLMGLSSHLVAQETTSIDMTRFRPGPGADVDLLSTQTLDVLSSLDWSAGVFFHYAHTPLQVRFPDDSTQDLISSQTMADIVVAIGIIDSFEIGVGLPVMLYQGGPGDGPFAAPSGLEVTNIGDLRLTPRFLFQDLDNLRLGISGTIYFPTGDEKAFLSDDAFNIEVRLLLDYRPHPQHLLAFNAGSRSREPRDLANLATGQEILLNVGYQYSMAFAALDLELIASLEGAATAGNIDGPHSAFELLLGARLGLGEISLIAGAGPGLTNGFGTPAFRAFLGAAYASRTPPEPPVVCEFGPEDYDGFLDDDGCAEPDNDEDGILDVDDRCPLEPETFNDERDDDGCPELLEIDTTPSRDALPRLEGADTTDTDGDAIPDAEDSCPDVAEDPDGFEDADGCPEHDNDDDGIADGDDACPLEAEVINGTDDADGCPDEGDAKVRVTRNRIEILESVQFETGKAVIRSQSYPILDQVASALGANPHITRVLVEGHTDDRGDAQINLELSQKRAIAVVAYLTDKGVEAQRLQSEGYGESRPIADNETSKGRAQNRRVAFTIIEVHGEPYTPPQETTP